MASTEIDLPADLAWSSPGAVVVEEREQNGRRRVRLATARGADTVLDVRRKVDSAEAEKLLAQSVVLTILQLRPEGLRRHDVVLYEVRRGGLARFTVELPPGLEIEQAGTDEGTVVPVVETGRLTVHRERQLQGVGYLVLSSTPPVAGRPTGLSLEAVRPEPEVRSRYLALSSAVAADVRPLPEASWTRVDTSDLPAVLSEALTALDLTAAWRLAADGAGARLAVAPLPAAPILDDHHPPARHHDPADRGRHAPLPRPLRRGLAEPGRGGARRDAAGGRQALVGQGGRAAGAAAGARRHGLGAARLQRRDARPRWRSSPCRRRRCRRAVRSSPSTCRR